MSTRDLDVGVSKEGARMHHAPADDGELWPDTPRNEDVLRYQRAAQHSGLRSVGVEHLEGREGTQVGLRATQGSSAAILSYLGDACPGREDECVFACVSAGLRAEAYGSYVLFVATYAGACDCKDVFKAPLPNLPDSLAPIEMEAAFMVAFVPPTMPHATVSQSTELLRRSSHLLMVVKVSSFETDTR